MYKNISRCGLVAALVVSGLQVAVGFFGVFLAGVLQRPAGATLPGWVLALQMLMFMGSSLVLWTRSRKDNRVLALAAIFGAIATSFARRPAEYLIDVGPLSTQMEMLGSLRIDAFLPYFLWCFFGDFPRTISSLRIRRVTEIGLVGSFGIGLSLFVANVWLGWIGEPDLGLGIFDAQESRTYFWTMIYAMIVAVFPFAIWRAGSAPVEERRRAILFVAGLSVTVLPISAFVFAEVLIDPFAEWMNEDGRIFLLPAIEACILLVPLATAYAVLVDEVLPVRILVRQALRFGLARAIVGIAVILPFAWILWAGYRLRDETLSELFAGRQLLAVGLAVVVGGAAIRMRVAARDAMNRTFFREAYDTREILLSVAKRSQQVRRTRDWADLLASEIDRALHLEHVVVMVLEIRERALVSVVGRTRPLDVDSGIVEMLTAKPRPLDVDLERPRSDLRVLPTTDRHWLADGAFGLLVPVVSSSLEVIALIALGSKRSELAFSGEDRELLSAIATSAALTLEHRLSLGSNPVVADDSEDHEPVLVCDRCGELADRGEECLVCSGRLTSGILPRDPLGKFYLERRVGVGGMGVVFRARDLTLGRTVAIKTLPHRSPEESALLRREARAMAAVVSPNLVAIYSAESWKGTPLLVTEFLEGGTLDDWIGRPVAVERVMALGVVLADALRALHKAGILHRDIKPSNIGFGAEDTPKLLDFGLAHGPDRELNERPGNSLVDEAVADVRCTNAVREGPCGTPLYMSPELLAGQSADAGSDLWALSLVLYEVLAGSNPVERRTWHETRQAINGCVIASLDELRPECPSPMVRFFAESLSPSIAHRPATASEFAARWGRACTSA